MAPVPENTGAVGSAQPVGPPPSGFSDTDLFEVEETFALCLDQADWLEALATRHGLPRGDHASAVLWRLIGRANAEPPAAKRQLFLQVRCRRCLQHTRGGEKRDLTLVLPRYHLRWLELIRERCKHATVGKTVRIILDFYRPLCDADPMLEEAIFGRAVAASRSPEASIRAEVRRGPGSPPPLLGGGFGRRGVPRAHVF